MDTLSTLQALMHLIKGYVGTGILAMPKAFSYSGLLIGAICTPIIGLLSSYCMHSLVNINNLICKKLNIDLQTLDYQDIAENAFNIGPQCLKRFSKLSRMAVIIFIMLSQFGYCCAYYLFIADNLKKFSKSSGFDFASMSIHYYLLLILPLMIVLNFIKSIKTLSYASTIANFLQLTSLTIVCYNLLDDIPNVTSRAAVGQEFPLFFSTALFTFAATTFTMPLYNSMRKPRRFGSTFGVLNIATVIVIIIYLLFGSLGYLKYGEEVGAVITLSLPEEPLYWFVPLIYAIAIILSYVWQMYVLIQLLWPYVLAHLDQTKKSALFVNLSDYAFRTLLVFLTFGFTSLIPKLDSVISLVGAVSCSSIVLIFPAILNIVAFWNEKNGLYSISWLCAKNVTVAIIGLLGFITGFYFSLRDIINFEQTLQVIKNDTDLVI